MEVILIFCGFHLSSPIINRLTALLNLQVNQMLEKGAIHVSPRQSKALLVVLLLSQKGEGVANKPVVNLSPLNQYIL